jgi:hypothetical protein
MKEHCKMVKERSKQAGKGEQAVMQYSEMYIHVTYISKMELLQKELSSFRGNIATWPNLRKA